MSKILIAGNSLAVVDAIENIRKNDGQSEISLLCTESFLPYDRFLLPSLVAGEIKESQLSPVEHDFFVRHRVEVIANEVLSRVSLKRKHVTTQNKRQIGYDQLLISDLGSLMSFSIKGHQKKGVFDCALLSSVKDLIKFLPFVDTVFVMATNIQGFNMACAFNVLGKEVVIVSPQQSLLSNIFDDETGALLKQIVETKGIRVITNCIVEEVLGDGEVKAVKLSSGKVVATQMVIIDSLSLDLRLLEAEEGYQRIEDKFFSLEAALRPWKFGFNVLNGFCMGLTKLPEKGREYLKFDGPQDVFKKIFAQGECLVGAVLFNAPSHEESLSKFIMEGTSVTGQEESLLGD